MHRKHFNIIIPVVLSVTIILFTLYQIGIEDVSRVLRYTDLRYVLLAIILTGGMIVIKSLRWFILLKETTPSLTLNKFLTPFLVGQSASTALPIKTGDLIRVGVNMHYMEVEMGDTISANAFYKLIDVITMVVFMFLALYYIGRGGIANVLILFWGALIIVTIIILSYKKLGLYIAGKLKINFIQKQVQLFYDGLTKYKQRRILGLILILTGARWIVDFFVFLFLYKAVSGEFNYLVGVIGALSYYITGIPFPVPAGVGVGNLLTTGVLGQLGVRVDVGFATTLLYSAFGMGIQIFVGLIAMVFLDREKSILQTLISGYKRAREEKQANSVALTQSKVD